MATLSCNGENYDDQSEHCCGNNIYPLFSGNARKCCNDVPQATNELCCADGPYDSTTHSCCGGNVIQGTCCGGQIVPQGSECCGDDTTGVIFDPSDPFSVCCGGKLTGVGELCCGDASQGTLYQTDDDTVCCHAPSGVLSQVPSGEECCADGKTGHTCCDGNALTDNQFCCNGVAGDDGTTSGSAEYCCNDEIQTDPCGCEDDSKYEAGVSHCCGTAAYEPGDQGCCDAENNKLYDIGSQCCHPESGVVTDIDNGKECCADGRTGHTCCDGKALTDNQFCCNGVAGDDGTTSGSAQYCCNDEIQDEPCDEPPTPTETECPSGTHKECTSSNQGISGIQSDCECVPNPASTQSDPHVKTFFGESYDL